MSVYNITFDTHQDLIEYLDENEPDQYAVYKHEDEDEDLNRSRLDPFHSKFHQNCIKIGIRDCFRIPQVTLIPNPSSKVKSDQIRPRS